MRRRLTPILASVFFTLVVVTAIAMYSCNKDKCVTTRCYNGGTCSAGLCTCACGYEGLTCTTEARQKFFGDWQALGKGSGQFAISIIGGEAINSVSIKNFNNSFVTPISGYVAGTDSLIIPSQVAEGKTVSGNALYVNSNIIQANYTITDQNGNSKSYSETW